jgi:hypothetical protein
LSVTNERPEKQGKIEKEPHGYKTHPELAELVGGGKCEPFTFSFLTRNSCLDPPARPEEQSHRDYLHCISDCIDWIGQGMQPARKWQLGDYRQHPRRWEDLEKNV